MPELVARQPIGPTFSVEGGANSFPGLFRIDSMERLAWCGLKLNQRRHAIAALDAQYRSMRRELERKLADFEAYFLPQAEDFTRAQAQETGERSVRTLGGLFGFRLVPGGPRVHDVASC